ncbi:tripartite tricarboxylate transporter substrate binding protein [Ramlibacter sp. AW1]|jgi:tripartite-type tricarboxylate transporter receptor subunit TctC|uniref:Tripartite tricarboxylate transporter substrate binding protein n=1 Tax=Ramlibacter aurantiacus TaxID=2801330 RepID=A0A937D8T0_9BURK|nr:tripartite tricarboxylate transporter substrate binding protein [Ramlibacter aurantiacus]MBL0422406.1 tripartite tricarboxylate transporter substrate binding protein [Ramlibacter aurantiacus]
MRAVHGHVRVGLDGEDRGKAEGVPFASPGLGSHGHLVGELFSSRAKLKMTHVPYNGGGPAVVDLMSGHIPTGFMTLGSLSQQVRSGKIRLLAVASAGRVAAFPDVPTFAELGYKELTGATWFGLAGPAQLPREITLKLNSAVRKALADPDVRAKLNAEAIEVGDLDPEKTAEFFRAEYARWAPIARQVPKKAAGPTPKTEAR